MSEDTEKEKFLTRWSRLKLQPEEAQASAQPKPALDPHAPPPELPPLDTLTIDSDFSGFFHPKVDENLRRAALRKLFSDPHFNVMDGLDVYIDDYSKSDPLPPEILAQLKQGQKILAWAREDQEKTASQAAASGAAVQPLEMIGDQQSVDPAVPPLVDPLRENQTVEPREKSND